MAYNTVLSLSPLRDLSVNHQTPKFQQLLYPNLYNNDYTLADSSVLEIYLSFFPPTITVNAFCFTCTSSRLSSRKYFRWCKFQFESSTPVITGMWQSNFNKMLPARLDVFT